MVSSFSRAVPTREAVVIAMGLVLFLGCAARQWVPLDLGPGAVELYVNGDRAQEVPPEVELRADRDHKLFVKKPGYVPELVVIETRVVAGRETLVPGGVRVRLLPIAGDRRIEIEEAGAASAE